jgi:Fe-S-cluster containining protein
MERRMDDFLDDLRRRAAEAGITCGPHCPGNRIPLTPYEVARIARGLGVTTGEVIRRHLRESTSVLGVDEDGNCVFHRTEGCKLDDDRPMACRNFADPAEGAGRFVERARQYRAVLRAWRATRKTEAGGAEENGPVSSADDQRERHAAPELGTWILDVDSMVADRCRERGMAVPEDLETRIDVHLEALRSALEG